MNFLKKYKWIIIGVFAVIVGVCALVGGIKMATPDAMFYEVTCTFPTENTLYSFIVDDKKTARAFKRDMNEAKCNITTYDRASDDTLFIYSVMTVLKDVDFALKEYSQDKNFYQVQYFDGDDAVVSLACQYKSVRYNCYDKMPEPAECPDNAVDAKKVLGDLCEFKEIGI